MWKRFLASLLCAAVCVFALTLLLPTAKAADIVDSGYCSSYYSSRWSLDSEGTLTISGKGVMADYSLTESADGSGAPPWAKYRSQIKSVVLESDVLGIGEAAFAYCDQLESVSLSGTFDEIPYAAFAYCSKLNRIVIPEKITKIKEMAFAQCTDLSYVFVRGTKLTVSENAFQGCVFECFMSKECSSTGMTSNGSVAVSIRYHFVDDVAETEAAEFVESGSCGENLIYQIGWDGTVTILGNGEFTSYEWTNYRNSTKKIYFPKNAKLYTVSDEMFYKFRRLREINLPATVTSIGESAFASCIALTEITIPDSVETIGTSAFSDCTALKQIALSYGVKTVGNSAFSGCAALEQIALPDSVETIGTSAFSGCTSLSAVTLSANLQRINDSTFENCTALTEIAIPDSVQRIGAFAFKNCAKLETLHIPASVSSFNASSVVGCDSLRAFTVAEENTNYAVDSYGALYTYDKTTLVRCPNAYVGVYTPEETMRSVGSYAFYGCAELTEISTPVNAPAYGFAYCTKLRSVTIQGAAKINEYAFAGCSSLETVDILDESLSEIGERAFGGCSSLKRIVLPHVGSICNFAFIGSGLKEVYFRSYVSSFYYFAFAYETATVYYPESYYTKWSGKVNQDYQGNLTWQAYLTLGTDLNCEHSQMTQTEVSSVCVGSYTLNTCACGFSYRTNVIPGDGHEMTVTSAAVAPTCTECGQTEGSVCSVCGYEVLPEEVAALGHDIVHYGAVAATCTKDGHEAGEYCTRCDYTAGGAVIPASHTTYVAVAGTPATCTEDGLSDKICCISCGATVQEQTVIAALGHDMQEVGACAATCTEAGHTAGRLCTRCGDSEGMTWSAALGHDYIWVIDREATDTEDGVKHEECTRCGDRRNENTPATHADSCPSLAFSDLDTSRWYHTGIDFMLRNGYMAGTGDGSTFSPNMTLTREQLAQILYAKAGKPTVTITGRFPDEETGRWYAAAVEWAAEQGYISGYGNGNFGVGDAVTREQIAVILYAYAGKPEVTSGTLDSHPDAGQVSGWARTAMVWAVENGLITGNAKGELMPKNEATRATFAVIFCAYLTKD